MQENLVTKFNTHSYFLKKEIHTKLEIEEDVLDLIKGIYKNPIANIIVRSNFK